MIRGTTILAVRHKAKVVVAGDGQVTLDTTVMKHRAKKVRKLYNDQVLAGFAGTTADAFTLYETRAGDRPLKVLIDAAGWQATA